MFPIARIRLLNMEKEKINYKRLVVWGGVIIFLQMLIFSVLWANPFVKGILSQFSTHSSIKTYEFIGGEENWKIARLVFHIMFMAVCMCIYLAVQRVIPGTVLIKGAIFGLIISIIRFVPESFNTWTLIEYPWQLVLLRLINGFTSFILFGVLVSVIFERSKVIVKQAGS